MKRLQFTYTCLLMSVFSFCQNPLVKDVGMSDPHIRVYNDTLYLYCGHDSHPDDPTWIMKEWRVFKSTDLLGWKQVGSISPGDNYMDDESTDCWAGDAATRNGQYYFYFSDRKRGIGVMQSDSPAGPFKDVLGKPLVSPLHDPTILIDDDPGQTPYIIYGDKSDSYYLARLNEDMISLAEAPRPVVIEGEEWEKAPEWMDKNYLFKYRGTYYLSWGRDYATSTNIYGPYTCRGSLGQGYHLDEFAHGSFFWWKGQFYHSWCYYLRDGYKYRETIISYCHFDDEGGLHTDTDFLDQHFSSGVGQYDASWPVIEAEWYTEVPAGVQKTGSPENGFVLSGIGDGDWVRFGHVNFSERYRVLEANLSLSGGTGELEIRADKLNGKLLGVIPIKPAGKGDVYQSLSCDLKKVKGNSDIVLRFRGDSKAELKLDWIKFSKY